MALLYVSRARIELSENDVFDIVKSAIEKDPSQYIIRLGFHKVLENMENCEVLKDREGKIKIMIIEE